MADGALQITPGTGAWVPIDSIAFGGQTCDFQFIKLMDASGGSTNRAKVSSGGALSVSSAQGALFAGQAKVAAGGTAQALTAQALTVGITIRALFSNNAAGMVVGPSGITNAVDGTGNGHVLFPGDSVFLPVANANEVFINGATGDAVSYVGA